MLGTVVIVVCIPLILFLWQKYRALVRNLAAAKASGIPYIISPIFALSPGWLYTQKIWEPFLRRLPSRWSSTWLDNILTDRAWNLRYEPFKNVNSDTFLIVAPGANELLTADASVISQVTTRRSDFPKPLELYVILMVYGPNVVTSEGQLWRAHRKITSLPFAEKNNHMVWAESIYQAQAMTKSWMRDEDSSPAISNLGENAMRMTLHIISRTVFGVRLQWPGSKDEQRRSLEDDGAANERSSGSTIVDGHAMSYTDTLVSLLDHIIWILVVPKTILKHLPFKAAKAAHLAYVEWGKYLQEMYLTKKAEIVSGTDTGGMDLMGVLVKGSGIHDETVNSSLKSDSDLPPLSEADILGNAFIFILAGHETTANSIHFSLIYLALHPDVQRKLQSDLDHIFQHRPIEDWDYERDMPRLFNGMAGAVLSEELRLIPPVVVIPKCTTDKPQQLVINGKKCTVPPNTDISIFTPSAHRNPHFWPPGPQTDHARTPIHPDSGSDNDLEQFKPERWFTHSIPPDTDHDAPTPEHEESHLDVPTSLFRPRRGAYIPFSEGPRACLGRRFAQVSVLAILAVIFSQYSIELALDDFGGEVERAADATRKLMRENLSSRFTLQLRGADVKVRFKKRGM